MTRTAITWQASNDGETDREQRMADLHEDAIAQLDDAIAIGEQGILVAGDLLGAIVREALAQGEETSGLLANANAGTLTAALEREAINAESHIATMDKTLSQLGAQTKKAMDTTRALGRAVSGFREVLMSTRMVGISLRIEVARLPSNSELGVIPDELRGLGSEIESLTAELESLTRSLKGVLPALEASNTRVARASGVVRNQVVDSVSELGNVTRVMCRAASTALRTRSEAAATIRSRCEAALSRLQFFDPMAQELQRIDTLICDYRSHVSEGASTVPIEPVRYGKRVGDTLAQEETSEVMTAGELVLF